MDALARPWISTHNPKTPSYPTIIGHCEGLRDFFKIMKTTFGWVIIADKFFILWRSGASSKEQTSLVFIY